MDSAACVAVLPPTSPTSTTPTPLPFHASARSLARAIVVGPPAGHAGDVTVISPGAISVVANAGTSPPDADTLSDSPPAHSGEVTRTIG